MSDAMRIIPFEQFMNWMVDELHARKSIFDYPRARIFRKQNGRWLPLFNEALEIPLGPAAGPHTQMAQNIVTAYLAGGRFFELKTVQKLDQLHIPRPCIEAQDEGYNVEWSQELRLEESFEEYVKTWFALHFLQALFQKPNAHFVRGFIFNMSVGYDLKGIQSPKMDWFINGLIDAGNETLFKNYRDFILNWLSQKATRKKIETLPGLPSDFAYQNVLATFENISAHISQSVTVSTMHGCPPEEIEAICTYLLKEKKLHTYVKLNPTLLGFEQVSDILKRLGYHYMELDAAAFEHDLQYAQAVPMIRRLQAVASEQQRDFGVKLTNTLGMKNRLDRLPGDEMYMSGRALYPLTVNLAARLAGDFEGALNISFSGGATVQNIPAILKTGIFPVTMVTDLLKPGGYLRLQQMVENLEQLDWPQWLSGKRLDVEKLKALAAQALSDARYRKERRQVESIKVKKSLPMFDCYLAPCREACPIHQDVAEYIRLVEEERYLDALRVILQTNPLPHITGYICDHQCMFHCTRWDYEDPVYIREMKRVAAEKAWEEFLQRYGDHLKPDHWNDVKVAIIGAGPAGLSAAYFLARAGFKVTVFEKEARAGGVVQNVIPDFRLPQYAIERDVDLIKRHGVELIFNARDININELKAQGFKYVFVAIGAGRPRKLSLNPSDGPVVDALEFLLDYKQGKTFRPGKRVAVIGGGNSAMDAARAAKRLPGVQEVFIVYRRTRAYMPADREEVEAALEEGVIFKELLLPVAFEKGKLTCQKMQLAEKGEDGRRQVKPLAGALEMLEVDAVISAIGEMVDESFLQKNGIKLVSASRESLMVETNVPGVFIGGDALRGPSTVVESIADGKRVAERIMQKEAIDMKREPEPGKLIDQQKLTDDLILRKGQIRSLQTEPLAEAARCVSCNVVCDKCVEVCPNRANVALPITNGASGFKDLAQIVHLDGLCNECGNCETFCPYQGKPYRDKITIFWTEEDFLNSANEGFLLISANGKFKFKVRFKNQIGEVRLNEEGHIVSTDIEQLKAPNHPWGSLLKEVALRHRYLLNPLQTIDKIPQKKEV